MSTLKDFMEDNRWTVTKVAEEADTSRPTIYALWRKDPVNWQILYRVCNVIGIKMDDYAKMEPCEHAPHYRKEAKRKKQS